MKKNLKILFRALKKTLKPRHIFLLIILLAGNTLAWFIYSKQVNGSVDVHVRSWKVLLKSGDTEINYVDVTVDNIYPGMDDFEDNFTIENRGEMNGSISYVLLSARILDDTYTSVEGRAELGEDPQADDMTSEELQEFLQDYPFHISFNVSNSELDAEIGESTFTTSVDWPYESGDDALDTQWGTNAYNYIHDNPSSPCIVLSLKIYITQASGS